MEISKEFIDQLLELVNKETNSKIRSKVNYGEFHIKQYQGLMGQQNQDSIKMILLYTQKDDKEEILLKKVYNLSIGILEEYESQFYEEIIKAFVGNEQITKIYNYGIK